MPKDSQLKWDETVLGTETEYGIYNPESLTQNPIELSVEAVQTYAKTYRGDWQPVHWDYRGEDPLNDVRGMRLSRAHADPSLLTDDPYHLAPSGGSESLPKPSIEEQRLLSPTGIVLPNGGRFYVDHAHPEYSSPETSTALEAVRWDFAGDVIARRVMKRREELGQEPLVFVKNNVDGKGATYGTHENYQISRETDLDEVIRFMIPFLVTRQIISGSGRVGKGQKSEFPGFQISQRADYVENDIGLETTFNRPIFNTRDEPHANHHRWRRIHVIGGDANLFDVSLLLRVGTTKLVLWAIEQGSDLSWDSLDLANSVSAVTEISHDPTLARKVQMFAGPDRTALDIQRQYFDLVVTAFHTAGRPIVGDDKLVLDTWLQVLNGLQDDVFSVARQVEWVGKLALLSRQKERIGAQWDDARVAALDLQWGDLRPQVSLVHKLKQAGLVEQLLEPEEIDWAADNPPSDTRAAVRGREVAANPNLAKASWTSLVFDQEEEEKYLRVPMAEPTGKGKAENE